MHLMYKSGFSTVIENGTEHSITEFKQSEGKRPIIRGENLAVSWTLKKKWIFHWRLSRGREVSSRRDLCLNKDS